jgi:hypothetical protein
MIMLPVATMLMIILVYLQKYLETIIQVLPNSHETFSHRIARTSTIEPVPLTRSSSLIAYK